MKDAVIMLAVGTFTAGVIIGFLLGLLTTLFMVGVLG